MKTVTSQAAIADLTRLLEEAHNGEEIVITDGKKPMARLVPLTQVAAPRRVFGSMQGRARVEERFFEPLPAEDLAPLE